MLLKLERWLENTVIGHQHVTVPGPVTPDEMEGAFVRPSYPAVDHSSKSNRSLTYQIHSSIHRHLLEIYIIRDIYISFV
jgi:hypothetical protein